MVAIYLNMSSWTYSYTYIYINMCIYISYLGIRYTLAKRISRLNCCFRRDVGINACLFRCERLNIWTEHLYNLSWRCIPTSHFMGKKAVSFKSLISEISTSYTNGRDPCRRPYLPPKLSAEIWGHHNYQPKQCIITREINPPKLPCICICIVWFPRNGSSFGAFKTPPKRDIRIANSGS